MTWLACFAGALASATGTLAIARRAPCCNIASPTELSCSWSNVSPELLNEYGGVFSGTLTQRQNPSVCRTNVCRNAGGHSYVCTDIGYSLTSMSSGFNYKLKNTQVCTSEMMYTFENCVSFYRDNGDCNGGGWTYTWYYDP
ncbi:MAG: hypothetical protein ACP5XB_22395 [Isosphaeraceae bacterium]